MNDGETATDRPRPRTAASNCRCGRGSKRAGPLDLPNRWPCSMEFPPGPADALSPASSDAPDSTKRRHLRDCGQLDPGAVIQPIRGERHPHMPDRLQARLCDSAVTKMPIADDGVRAPLQADPGSTRIMQRKRRPTSKVDAMTVLGVLRPRSARIVHERSGCFGCHRADIYGSPRWRTVVVRDDVHGGFDLARGAAQPALAREGFGIETVAVDVTRGERIQNLARSRYALFYRCGCPCCALEFAAGFGHAVRLPLAGHAVKKCWRI
jgi:hypothetical protein